MDMFPVPFLLLLFGNKLISFIMLCWESGSYLCFALFICLLLSLLMAHVFHASSQVFTIVSLFFAQWFLNRRWEDHHTIPLKLNFFFECLPACLCDEKTNYTQFNAVNQTYCQPSLQSRPVQHHHCTKFSLPLRVSEPSKTTWTGTWKACHRSGTLRTYIISTISWRCQLLFNITSIFK